MEILEYFYPNNPQYKYQMSLHTNH